MGVGQRFRATLGLVFVLLACGLLTTAKAQNSPNESILRPRSTQKEVSFKTGDGWTIYGTLTIPAAHQAGDTWPAALLLHSATHTQIVWGVYPGWVKIQESLVTLRIDWRGRGKSQDPVPFAEFTPSQREKVALDVASAIDFLASQPEVDSTRIGVAAEGFSVNPAVMGAVEDSRVRICVLISGSLSQTALDLVASNPSKPMLFVVSKEDTPSLESSTRAFGLSHNPESDIWVQDGLGIGLAMGSMWRNKYPDRPIEEAIDYSVGAWLVSQLRRLGRFNEITLQTRDGWILLADLGLPDNIKEGHRVPGVVLLPTALSDRTSYYNLGRMLVAQGIAVLNLDWRSIGESTNRGTLLDMTATEMSKALYDAQEGVRFLLSQRGVDPDRIAVLGTAFGAKLAMQMGAENPRIRAVIMITPVVKPHELEGECRTADALRQPVLLVTGRDFGDASKKFVEFVARVKRNTIITYPGGILGTSLFEVDKTLEPTIIAWLKKQLGDINN